MRTGRAVLLKGFADVSGRLAALITFPIVAHYAGAAGYGAFTQMNVIIGFIVPFASLGLGSVMVRFFVAPPWSPSVSRRALRVGAAVLGAGLAISGVVALLASTLNDLFLGYPEGDELFRWGSALIALGAVEFWLLDLLRARDWLASFSIFQLAQTALLVAAVAILLPSGYSIVDLVAATVVLKALALLVALLIFVIRSPREPEPAEPVHHATFKEMMRFGFPLTVAGLGLWMVNLSDRLVIGYFMTPTDLGVYGAIYTVGSMLLLTTAALFLPAYPRFMSAVLAGDTQRLRDDVSTFHRFVSLTVVPGAVFLVAMIHPVLLVLGGSEFDIDILVAILIISGLFIDQWNGLAHYVIAAYDRTVFLQNVWLICGALNIALNLIAVPEFGLRGAGAVTLISFVVLEVSVYRAASRHLPLREAYHWGTTLRAGLAAALAGGASALILAAISQELLGAAVAGLAFWAVYTTAIALMRELHKRDLALLLGALGLRPRWLTGA